MWILAAKLPKLNLNFAVDFGVEDFSFFSEDKAPEKSTQEIHSKLAQKFGRKNSPQISAEAFLDEAVNAWGVNKTHLDSPKTC